MDFDQLKNNWQQQDTDLPTASEVLKRAEQTVAGFKRKQLSNVVLYSATATAVVWIHYVCSQKMQTSLGGFVLLLACSLYYAGMKLFLFGRLKNILPSQNTSAFMKQLFAYNKLNTFLLTYGEIMYVLALSAGVYLYMRPLLSGNTLNYTLCAMALFLVWTVFHTFFIKRKEAIMESKKISDLIASVESSN